MIFFRKATVRLTWNWPLMKALFILFLFVLPIKMRAQQENAGAEELKAAMHALGYHNLIVSDCYVFYARSFDQSKTNNGYSGKATHLHLDTLKDFSEQEIEILNSGDQAHYILYLVFRDDYHQTLEQAARFSWWAGNEYPASNWPYSHPTEFDAFTALLEIELRNRVENLERLNRSVTFSDYGRTTYILPAAETVVSEDQIQLFNLRDRLSEYAHTQGCDNRNGMGTDR